MSAQSGTQSSFGRPWQVLSLLGFWVGFNLRAPLLAVPPVLAQIRSGLHLNYAEAGLITAIPILLFGCAALPGAAVVRRIGGFLAVLGGLALAALGELFRAAPLGAFPIFAGTAAMGLGISLAQPGLPALLQRWFSGNVQRASVTVTLGITVGEVVASGITQPLVFPFVGGWQGVMVFWGAVGASAVVVWGLVAPRVRLGAAQGQGWELGSLLMAPRLWLVYLMFAGQSLAFFSANTWIPTAASGGAKSALATVCLATLNGVMVPVDLVLIFSNRQFATHRSYYISSGLVTVAGACGWLFGPGGWMLVVSSALIGSGVAMNFAGLMAYPPLVAPSHRVASLTAAMLTVGYLVAFLGPLLGGVVLDAGWGRRSPFIPIALASAMIVVAALWAPLHGRGEGKQVVSVYVAGGP